MVNAALWRVVVRDGLARSWALIFCACLVLLALESTLGYAGCAWPRAVLMLVSMFLGFMMLMRAAFVAGLLVRGERAQGMVVEAPSIGLARYHFEHEGKKHEGAVFVTGPGQIKKGEAVTVCFDPQRPENSVLLEVFL